MGALIFTTKWTVDYEIKMKKLDHDEKKVYDSNQIKKEVKKMKSTRYTTTSVIINSIIIIDQRYL
ncbi:hypothetical protein ACF3NG_10690 [Aerococcaceae bacterium WGS1372]